MCTMQKCCWYCKWQSFSVLLHAFKVCDLYNITSRIVCYCCSFHRRKVYLKLSFRHRYLGEVSDIRSTSSVNVSALKIQNFACMMYNVMLCDFIEKFQRKSVAYFANLWNTSGQMASQTLIKHIETMHLPSYLVTWYLHK